MIRKNNIKKNKVGIIGGMGPLATVELQRLIIELTHAEYDQDHIEIIVHNNTRIPDRTESLKKNNGRDFTEAIIESGYSLIGIGADILAMPCNTAHARFENIQAALPVPVINMIELTARACIDLEVGTPIAILATDGCIREKVFTNIFDLHEIPYILPYELEQQKIMKAIYEIKARKYDVAYRHLQSAVQALTLQGTRSLLLGCTELSLLFEEFKEFDMQILDPLRLLAHDIVVRAGKTIPLHKKNEPLRR